LTTSTIYAIVRQINKKTMNKEQIIEDLVDWCLDRTEELTDEDDELSLLQEFDEWICYKNGEIATSDFIYLECLI
jgi:hypothetical protein